MRDPGGYLIESDDICRDLDTNDLLQAPVGLWAVLEKLVSRGPHKNRTDTIV